MTAELPAVTGTVDIEPRYAAELALVQERMGSEPWRKIEEIEAVLERCEQEQMPLRHLFTPGLYIREILMRKGTFITTRIHLTEHPFVISAGVVSVWDDENGWVTLRAPHTGITKAGTRRMLYIHEDTIWSTFHATEEKDPDVIVEAITFCGGKFASLGIAAKQTGRLTP